MSLRVLVLAALILAWMTATPGVADAADPTSDFVVEASPGPDDVLLAAPERLSITFAEPVTGAAIRVFDDAGRERSLAATASSASSVNATPELLGEGRYLLAWEATGETAGRNSGAYVFAVDPAATGAVIVDRQVTGSRSAEATRTLGIAAAGLGWALLAGSVLAAALAPRRGSRQLTGAAGALMATGALLGLVGVGGQLDGSSLISAFDTAAGRGWLGVLAASLVVPYLVLRWGSEDDAPRRALWRALAGAALIVAAGGLLVGIDAETIPVLPAAAVGIAAAACVTTALLGRKAAAAVAGIVVIALVGVIVVQTREYGFVHRDDLGPVLLEVAVDPARRGVNELHLYGFDAGGGLAELGDTTAWVTHVPTAVGPMEVPLLRAGPNHFLTYGAELPLPGAWEIEMHTSTPGSADLETTAIVEVR